MAQNDTDPVVAIADTLNTFSTTCLKYPGQTNNVRDYLRAERAPEFSARDGAMFTSGRVGRAYNVSTKSTRIAIVLEDNGVCSVFMGSGDASDVASSLNSMLKNLDIASEKLSDVRSDVMQSTAERLRLGSKDYNLIISVNAKPNALIKSIITLAPAVL